MIRRKYPRKGSRKIPPPEPSPTRGEGAISTILRRNSSGISIRSGLLSIISSLLDTSDSLPPGMGEGLGMGVTRLWEQPEYRPKRIMIAHRIDGLTFIILQIDAIIMVVPDGFCQVSV